MVGKKVGFALGMLALAGSSRFIYKVYKMREVVSTRFKSLSINKTRTLDRVSLTFNLIISNPTNSSLHIREIAGGLFLEGRKVASFKTKKSFVVQPGNTEISFAANLSNAGVIDSIVQMAFKRKVGPIQVNYILDSGIPLIKIPQSFNFSAKDLL